MIHFLFSVNSVKKKNNSQLEQRPTIITTSPGLSVAMVFMPSRMDLGWKFMSCIHSQKLCQQVRRLLIGCTRVNNQSEARLASWPNSWQSLQLISFHSREVRAEVVTFGERLRRGTKKKEEREGLEEEMRSISEMESLPGYHSLQLSLQENLIKGHICTDGGKLHR